MSITPLVSSQTAVDHKEGEKIAVVGLGYVGLPLCLALAEVFPNVVGFDIDQQRVQALCASNDYTGEVAPDVLAQTSVILTTDAEALHGATFIIVTVPTPVDSAKRPDLTPLLRACAMIGAVLRASSPRSAGSLVPLVVFESTVYPGLTENVCGAALAKESGLTMGEGFRLGYSPERINPGDPARAVHTITKIISAADPDSLARMENVYGSVVRAGLHKVPSIAVAEAGKVIENTQRDLNIALMNEFALICDRLGLATRDVLAAAGTKWNFLPFSPGLVGGHCIGVDPYYLTTRAQEVGYHPEVVLAGRRVNDYMPRFVAQKTMRLLATTSEKRLVAMPLARAIPRVGILGMTFKENIRDTRNSRIPDIVEELRAFGAEVMVHDPRADQGKVAEEYGLSLVGDADLCDLDALILAVAHQEFLADPRALWQRVRQGGVVIDVKSVLSPSDAPEGVVYWSL